MSRDAPAGPEARPFIGRPMPRFEDQRLLAGRGRYTDDFALPGQCHAVFLRAQEASARIVSIDAEAARAMPGVRLVLTGADYVAGGGGPIRHFADPADARDHTRRAFGGYEGNLVHDVPHLPMPCERVRYLGEPLAMVVADSRAAAEDAAEAIQVDLEGLPSVTDAEAALAEGAPLVDPDIAGNLCVSASFGDPAAAKRAIAAAAHVVRGRFPAQRVANAQMEPRSVIADYDAGTGRYLMIAGSQGAVRQRDTLAAALGVGREAVEVVCPDTGGGFGPRTNLSPEQPVLAMAARMLECPVRWVSTRSEAFLTDYQGRDLVYHAELGLDPGGRITGYFAQITGNVGAYTLAFVPMANSFRVMTTVYDVPAAGVLIRGAMTHTVPTAPYRGAGRPEATYAMERLLDIAARRMGLDRVEIRRRNLISKAGLPRRTAMGLVYDSGDFAGNMAAALHAADWDGVERRRTASRARGLLRGAGVANYVESPVGIPHERIDVTVAPEGGIEVVTGTQSTGQGHETSFAQVVADLLGVTPDEVRLVSGDTRRVQSGGGSHSDRSMRLGGALLVENAGKLLNRAREIVAHVEGQAVADVRCEGGLLLPAGSNTAYTIYDAARLADSDRVPPALRGPLKASSSFTGRMPAHPTGAAVCEVEIDPETGVVRIDRYTSIDDAGQPINPLILHGQVHGGIAQGVGQALGEAIVADATGQTISGSFMDYTMPRADMLPNLTVALVEDPTESNPLRVKGGGESGITPALATTINAVVDALSDYGIEHIDMPASPHRVWQAIDQARESKA